MNRSTFRRVAAPGIAALALGLGLSACAAGNEGGGETENGAATVEGLSGTLNGAGASSQEAAQQAWQAGFQTANADVTVNYDPVGSGGGREQFISGGVDFAGSDAYLDDDEGELSGAKERCGADPIEIPNYVSPIAVIYNLEGVEELNLSAPVIAEIFDGKITKWNDPKIAELNPDAELPGDAITAVHRADDSGTTENFTDYLSQAGEGTWKHEPDGVWPTKTGEAANGTSGVVSAVQNGTGTIGYADASQAGDLGVANVQVGEDFVGPTAEAAAKILEVSSRVEGRGETDMAFDLDRTTQEAGAYPVVLTSYLIACPTYDDQETADLVKGYLSYIVSDEGQQAAADSAGSAPLADSLQQEAEGIVEKISAKG